MKPCSRKVERYFNSLTTIIVVLFSGIHWMPSNVHNSIAYGKSEIELNWFESRAACETDGATLVVIETDEINQLISQLFNVELTYDELNYFS